MSALPAQPLAQNDPGQHAADVRTHREVLNGLITMGADFARLLHAQAKAQAEATNPDAAAPAPAPAADTLTNLAAAFDRITRAVRRTIILARSLDRPVPPARDPAAQRSAARKRIIREVEDAIGRTGEAEIWDTGSTAAGLRAELRDRLDAPDLDDDIASRPVADIITEICRDLGLASPPGTHPWQRRTPMDVADLRTRAAAPSRPCPKDESPVAQHSSAHQPIGSGLSPGASLAPPPRGTWPSSDAASEVAAILRHPAHQRGHWHPPPGD